MVQTDQMPEVSVPAAVDVQHNSMGGPARRPRVVIVTNTEWFFLSHRLPIAKGLRKVGYDVTVAAASERNAKAQIMEEGFSFVEIPFKRGSRNPANDLATLLRLVRLYSRLRPDVVHHVTTKPIMYGSLAARLTRVPHVINAISGLGYLFTGHEWRARLRAAAATLAYRATCRNKQKRFIFQNPEDRQLFLTHGIARAEETALIRGSGVDLTAFSPSPPPPGTPVILLPSRLLWDKGLGELVAAGRELRNAQVAFRLVLAGDIDEHNPRSADAATIRAWEQEGLVEWWGHRTDMPDVMREASIIALPSYREGLPKALLEAGASGRPSVTTNVPGCREVVRHGMNGLLVPPRDVAGLAAALRQLLEDEPMRLEMGARARQIVVDEFSEQRVVEDTLNLYQRLLHSRADHTDPLGPDSAGVGAQA